jgi:hypothetical protein
MFSEKVFATAIIDLGREPGGGSRRPPGCIHGRASRADHIGGGPKQVPTKFEMAVKALGLAVSPSILLRVDDMIE